MTPPLDRGEIELYQAAVLRWRALSFEQILTEAARLFNLAVKIARDSR